MKLIKLTKIKTRYLHEIFQSLDIKFAFVNKKFEEVSLPAKCRDFLGDCIWSKKTGERANIYSFVYDYKKTPFDDCRFSLKFPDDESYQNFIANLSMLHEKEKIAGVKLSKILLTDDKTTLVIEGSNYWIKDSWKVSLYTFYLKLMSYKTISAVKSPEDSYITYLTPEIESKMLAKVKKTSEKVAKDISTQHNYSGFLSAIKGKNYVAVDNHKLIFGDTI